MAASTLRPCFGQPAEVCTSCMFNTVTVHLYHGYITFTCSFLLLFSFNLKNTPQVVGEEEYWFYKFKN
jgi:hypothetical protein